MLLYNPSPANKPMVTACRHADLGTYTHLTSHVCVSAPGVRVCAM